LTARSFYAPYLAVFIDLDDAVEYSVQIGRVFRFVSFFQVYGMGQQLALSRAFSMPSFRHMRASMATRAVPRSRKPPSAYDYAAAVHKGPFDRCHRSGYPSRR
jgi:hypothetical protein